MKCELKQSLFQMDEGWLDEPFYSAVGSWMVPTDVCTSELIMSRGVSRISKIRWHKGGGVKQGGGMKIALYR